MKQVPHFLYKGIFACWIQIYQDMEDPNKCVLTKKAKYAENLKCWHKNYCNIPRHIYNPKMLQVTLDWYASYKYCIKFHIDIASCLQWLQISENKWKIPQILIFHIQFVLYCYHCYLCVVEHYLFECCILAKSTQKEPTIRKTYTFCLHFRILE